MSRRQLPRAAASVLDAATFLPGEIAVDTTNDELRYDGDGSTVGGIALARKDGANISVTATGSTTAKTLTDWMAGVLSASTFTSGDATPSVLNGTQFITAGSTAITDFDDAVEGQVIYVYRGSADITITRDATKIETLTAASVTLTATHPMISFRSVSGVWQEVERTGNVAAAPNSPEYIVAASNSELTAERVVTNTATVEWDTGTAAQLKANVPAGGIGPTQLASNAVETAKIADANVTLAKMANIATDRLIGRDSASTGVPEALTVGGGIEFTGSGGIQRSALTGAVTASAGSNTTAIASAILNAMAANSGITGTITVSTSAPSGGSDGDIWLERAS